MYINTAKLLKGNMEAERRRLTPTDDGSGVSKCCVVSGEVLWW